ncbi:MAG: SDR family NAD(P)-dependent oxidoreductase [Tenericutes bacterium]|nr:SDR family NAD(P)-dependent oxidoreductase [Mycoplasmatota bacterium]
MRETFTIITGATSGIGYETAKKLFIEGHHLILGNRNNIKAEKLKEELLKINPNGHVDLLQVNLSSFSLIKSFCDKVLSDYEYIDVLINNAGVFMREKAFTQEGFEMTMGVNYLGTYYLTELLIDRLLEGKNSKIIMVSSIGCYWGSLKVKPNIFVRRTNGFKDYFNSKLANLIYAKELLEKHRNSNLIIKAADPGVAYSKIWKWKTKFGESLDKLYQIITNTSEEAARIIVILANTNKYDKDNNLLYKFDKPRKLPKRVHKKKLRDDFIKFTEESIKQNI